MTEKLPTPEDLAEEERDPTTYELVNEKGEHVRYVRQSEFEKMLRLAQVLLDDNGFWQMK